MNLQKNVSDITSKLVDAKVAINDLEEENVSFLWCKLPANLRNI